MIDPSTYHDRPELSSSQVAEFFDCPITWWHVHREMDWPKPPPTPPMKFGAAVHKMIELGGPDKVAARVPRDCLNEKGHRRGEAWTQFKEETLEENPDAYFVNPGDIDPFHVIWNHLMQNDWTRNWATSNEFDRERIFLWTHRTGLNCRSMLDVVGKANPFFLDWKTTCHTKVRQILSDFHKRHYIKRLAFYREALIYNLGEAWRNCPVVVVTIENKGGYRVRPIQIEQSWLDEASKELETGLDDLASFDIETELRQEPILVDSESWKIK